MCIILYSLYLFDLIVFLGMSKQLVDKVISDHKVVVFSKSYCPFCKMAKDALNSTGAKFHLIELDERGNNINC